MDFYGDQRRDLSDLDRLLQRACGALGRLRAEQIMRGLTPSSMPLPSAYPAYVPPAVAKTLAARAGADVDHDAAVAESLALMDAEMRAAIDAALVAEYPRLQRLRERVAADAYADDDEWAALSQRDRARLRFAVWLMRHGQMSEWRADGVTDDAGDADSREPSHDVAEAG